MGNRSQTAPVKSCCTFIGSFSINECIKNKKENLIMAGNLMKNLVQEIQTLSDTQRKQLVEECLSTIIFDGENARFADRTGTIAVFTMPRLGIPEGRPLNFSENALFKYIVTDLMSGGNIEELKAVIEGASAENANKIVKVYQIFGQEVSMAILQYVLCFACADGIVEPEVEDRLESIFGMSLLADFFQSGEESVPVPRNKVTLTPLENDIVQWLNKDKGMPPLKKIQSHFSSYSASTVTQALKHLEQLGLVSGGEKIIGNAYYLMDDVFENTDITVDRSQEKAKAEAEAKAKAEAEEKRKQEEAMADYEQKYAQWKKNCEEVEKNREKMISRLCEDEKRKLIANAEKDHAHQAKYLGKNIQDLEKRKASAEATLSSLGFFKFKQKREQRAIIAELNDELSTANASLAENEETYQNAISNADETVEKKKKDFQTRAAQKHPMPNKPIKPAVPSNPIKPVMPSKPTALELANEGIKQEILAFLASNPNACYTAEEIAEKVFPELSNQKVTSLLSELTAKGKIVRTYEKRKAYFASL